jgi:hypothetical protein
VNATIAGDANQDGNYGNDRLPGARRNSFVGPDYSSTDMRIARRIYSRNGWKIEFTAESFNLFNRLNSRFQLTSDGAISNAAQFIMELRSLESGTFLPTTRCLLTSCTLPMLMRPVRFSSLCV